MSVQSVITTTIGGQFLSNLKSKTEALITSVTGTSKVLRTPSFTCLAADTFWRKYEELMHLTVGSGFSAPAFAVEGAVYFNGDSRDWLSGQSVNERKVVSTMVHEFFHSSSNGGKGLQDEERVHFKGPGSFMYMDEVMTDLFGYVLYEQLGLATDGNYESAYISHKTSSLSVGKANGSWLSIAFFLPAFDGLRAQIAKVYFHGGSLGSMDVDLPRCIKACELLGEAREKNRGGRGTLPAGPNYGLPFSYSADRTAIGVAIVGRSYLPLCDIVGSAIPVGHATSLVALLT